ncbi:MAG: hypothetical protein ACTSRZ_05220 [Promethearchaeota archaeon]
MLIRSGDFWFITWKFKRYLKKANFKVFYYKKKRKIRKKKIDLVIYLITESQAFNRNHLLVNMRSIGGMRWFAEGYPTIFISLANPYHLYEFPRIKTMINAYAPFPIVQKVIVEKLIGKQRFKGKSPVDAFCGLFDAKI